MQRLGPNNDGLETHYDCTLYVNEAQLQKMHESIISWVLFSRYGRHNKELERHIIQTSCVVCEVGQAIVGNCCEALSGTQDGRVQVIA